MSGGACGSSFTNTQLPKRSQRTLTSERHDVSRPTKSRLSRMFMSLPSSAYVQP